MGIQDRDYYQQRNAGIQFGLPTSITGRLILLNVVIYLADVFLVHGWFQTTFALKSGDATQPLHWGRLLSYGFLHEETGIWHIVGNMLGLFFFGRDIEVIYGSRRYLGFYLTALIFPAIVWLFAFRLMNQPHVEGVLYGASGAVTAVIILFAIHYPRRTILLNFFIPAPAWLLGLLIIAGNLFGSRTSPSNDAVQIAYDVHLAGAAYAALFYFTQWELLTFWRWRTPRVRFPSLRRSPPLKIHDPTSSIDRLAEQADAILEKLHREGESSLSARERSILEEYSRRVRSRRS